MGAMAVPPSSIANRASAPRRMGMKSRRPSLIIAAALLLGGSASPDQRGPDTDPRLAAAIHALDAKDLRIATIAYRLQTASLALCKTHTRLPGLVVQESAQYRPDLRPAMAALYGLGDHASVTAVVPGGPADKAGVHVGDAILSVNGQPLRDSVPIGGKTSADHDRIVAALDAAFKAGPVTLALQRRGTSITLTVDGAPACASIVQLDLSHTQNADADGTTITVTQGMADYADSDDELAFVIGHELSHNLLGHRALLDGAGTNRHGAVFSLGAEARRIRATEEEADYYGLYAVALAGYDVRSASRLWQRWGRDHPLRNLLADGSHPTNHRRIEALDREVLEIDGKRRAGLPLTPAYEDFIRRRD